MLWLKNNCTPNHIMNIQYTYQKFNDTKTIVDIHIKSCMLTPDIKKKFSGRFFFAF